MRQVVAYKRLKKKKKKIENHSKRQLQNVTRSLTGGGRFREVPTVTLSLTGKVWVF